MTAPGLNLVDRLTNAARARDNLKARISAYLARRSGVSIVELARDVTGVAGNMAWGSATINVIIWPSMSAGAIEAMTALIGDGTINPVPSDLLVYAFDGSAPDLPVAHHLDMVYREPHWFPVVFSGSEC